MKKVTITLLALTISWTGIKAQKLEIAERYAGYGQIETVEMNVSDGDTVTIVGSYAGGTPDVDPGPANVSLPTASSFGLYLLKYTDDMEYVSHAAVVGNSTSITTFSACFDNDDNIYVVGTYQGTVDFDPGAGITNLTSGNPSNNSGFLVKYDKNFNLIWSINFANPGYTVAYDVQTNSLGEVFVTGQTNQTLDVDPSANAVNVTPPPGSNTFLIKYSPSGAYLNHIVGMGTGISFVSIDQNNDDLSIVGKFNYAVDFDPSPSTALLTPPNSDDVYIAKYTSDLTYIYAKTIGNSEFENIITINSDNQSNLLIYGNFIGSLDFDPEAGISTLDCGTDRHSFLLKLDENGSFNWVKEYDWYDFYAQNNRPQLIHFDDLGNIYFHNHFTDSINIDLGNTNTTLYPTGTKDGYVVKYDASGNYIWNIQLGGNPTGYHYTRVSTANIDEYGVVRIEGNMRGINDFDPSPYETFGITNFTSFYSGFYAKYNQLTTGAVSSSICEGATFDVSFNNPKDLKSGNVYTVELSDATGDFSSPTVIGTLNSNSASGIVSATMPTGISGAAYRVRVVSSMPHLTGERNDADIEILKLPNINTQPLAATTCEGDSTAIFVATTGTDSYNWYKDNVVIPNTDNDSIIFTISATADQGLYYTVATNACGTTNSDTVLLTINPDYSINENKDVCYGGSYTFPDGTTQNNITADLIYTSNLQTVSSSCDSIIVTNLTVTEINSTVTQNGNALEVGQANATYQWFDCDNSSAIPNADEQTYTATTSGTYQVEIDYNGCTATSSCETIQLAGINQMNLNELKVYPNPSNGLFTVEYSNEIEKVEIYTVDGKLVATVAGNNGSKVLINASDWNSGNYLLMITSNGVSIPQRFVKH